MELFQLLVTSEIVKGQSGKRGWMLKKKEKQNEKKKNTRDVIGEGVEVL